VAEIKTVSLDLAKNWFQMHGADAQGRPVLRKKLARGKLLAFSANLPRCLAGMEACGGAHPFGTSGADRCATGSPIKAGDPQVASEARYT
jgi:hypothetical protein